MENQTTYTAIAYNHSCIGMLISFDVYKSTIKVNKTDSYLTLKLHCKPFTSIRIPFDETIEKGKTYYSFDYGQKAIAVNRTAPMEALRDAFNLLARKHPTLFEPHHLSTAMWKFISTLRRMYQDENISDVSFSMRKNKTYILTYRDREGKTVTVRNGYIE